MRLRADGQQRVTNTELFFDLVYVFAVTQLARYLTHDLTWQGAVQSVLLLVAVWWAWMYTAWMTNWLHPDVRAVRTVLLAVMLTSLVMSAALPEAFGSRGAMFAVTYVLIQLGRTLFALYAMRREGVLRRNFQRITLWLLPSGACWLVGGFVTGDARDAWWLAAVLIDLSAPAAGFQVPGLGRSTTGDWTIAGDHLAERCGMFVLIALGESVVDIGTSFSDTAFTFSRVIAFVLAFLGTVALWWIYFDRGAEDSSRMIATSADPGRLGRSAYTYFHLPMVAGVIVTAVADQLVIADPDGAGRPAITLVTLAGPALFLFGHFLFKRAVFRVWSLSRVIALVLLAALIPVGSVVSPLALGALTSAVVVGVVIADVLRYPAGDPT